MRRWMQLGLTGRMFLLVVIAVLPALVIQAVNEYALRTSREDEIRQRVIQITKQFGEEIQAIRAGASQLLIALGELDEVQKRDSQECGAMQDWLRHGRATLRRWTGSRRLRQRLLPE